MITTEPGCTACCTNVSRLSAEASATRCIRMRPMARPRTLGRNDHQRLLPQVSAASARLEPAHEGLVHLDLLRHPVPARPHHRASQLVQPRPRRAVAAQAEHAL